MVKLGLEGVRTVLCIGSHADDIEIGCGGTIMKLLAANPSIKVHWVVLSADGPRVGEAARGARLVLRDARDADVVVKEFSDSQFPFEGARIRAYFEELGRTTAPDLVLTHRREDMHQDHRLVAELTWCIFRDHLILEYEIPKYEGDLGQPNLFVPLDEATCRRKVEALVNSFETQRPKPWFSPETFWSLLRIRGVECNSPTQFAEALYCRKLTV